MAHITINVINPAETEKITMQVPDDVITRDLRKAIVTTIGLPIYDRNRKRLRYHLSLRDDNSRLERLDFRKTLAENEVCNGDTLQLTVEMLAGCFLPGTMITLADGKHMPIENLKIGDKVLSYDTNGKQFCEGIVSEVFTGVSDDYLLINNKIRITDTHLVFSNNKWIQAKQLNKGDVLYTENGTTLLVDNINKQETKTSIYNLHLNSLAHTFFAEGILVHNLLAKYNALQQDSYEEDIVNEEALKVFLCHSSSDKPKVRELYIQLRRDNINPWLDEENILPGQDWENEIANAVNNSDVVIVCLSKDSTSKA